MPNRIHPTAVLGPGVELGSGNVVGLYAVVLGPCRIGDDDWIGPHVVPGTRRRSAGTTTGPPGTATWSAVARRSGTTRRCASTRPSTRARRR